MRYTLLVIGMTWGVQFAAPPFVLSADLETIQARGYLIVAVKDNWRPLGYVDDAGDLVGLEIDIARRLAAEILGDADAVELRPVTNVERLPAVLTGEVDVAIAGIAITPLRERIVSFSVPYYLDGTGFVTRSPQIQTLEDLGSGAIALIEGSEAVTTVHYHLPNAQLFGVSSYAAALTRLDQGEADAFAGDLSILAGWVQEHPEYSLLPEVLTAEPLAVTLPKGNQYTTLRRTINAALMQWHEEGWLEERATYWGLP